MQSFIAADRLWNNGRIIDHPLVAVEDGRIVSISPREGAEAPAQAQILEFPGATLAPAYFDIHIHGSAGHDCMEATPGALSAMSSYLAAHGTGSYLATTVTAPVDATLRALAGLARQIAAPSAHGQARMAGIHLEGPFLSHLRRGAHPPDLLLEPDIDLFERMFEAAEGHVRLITLAPELPGAGELAAHAVSRGVRVSIGHSNATAGEARAAIAAGAASATHTFNAMRPLDHREPGILGVTLTTDSLFAELICDGIHNEPEMSRIFWRSKGAERAILVTDAMSATGMGDGEFRLGEFTVRVENGRATIGDVLAGSTLTLDRGLANFVAFSGAELDAVLHAVTVNPMALTGIDACSLAPGRPANLVVLDDRGKRLSSIIDGAQV
jgi:N-acetylglucosamine-6-phosphate deacetylase